MSKEFTKNYAINRITELTEELNKLNDSYNETMKYLNKLRDENNRLKQQLEEKDKEIDYWKDKTRNKILNMKATDFMKMCIGCGLMLDITEQQVPLAVRELEKVKDTLKHFCDIHSDEYYGVKAQVKGLELDVCEEIDNQIKVLKGENYEEATKYIYKLAQLEDIMERLGINFVEDLEDEVRSLRVDKYIYKKDRDTWERACELASETLKQVMGKPLWIGGNIPTPEVKDSDYFYQQAKTEGNDERN